MKWSDGLIFSEAWSLRGRGEEGVGEGNASAGRGEGGRRQGGLGKRRLTLECVQIRGGGGGG